MTDLLTREAPIEKVDDQAREVSGMAVPYGVATGVEGYTELVEPGAVQDRDGIKLFWRHQEPIGLITKAEHTDAGWNITAKISQTPRGDEVYTLLRDGVIDKFSIGFQPVKEFTDEDGTVHRTEILVREVSLVPFPAYEDAAVEQVRSAPNHKEDPAMGATTTDADLTEVREAIDDISRELALVKSNTTPPEPAGDQFRSFGHYVKAVASGDEAALRAYTGATTGDAILKDAWIGNLTRILGGRQPVKNAFTTGALPSTGLKVEYAKLKSDTTQVTKQASEGTDLAYGKVAIETATADVETYGGYSELSRQVIERSDVGILDTTFTALAVKYATAIETKVRTVLNAAFDASGAGALQSVTLPSTGDDDIKWISALIDVAQKFDDNERTLAGLFVSKPVFLTLAAIAGKDRFMQVAGGPAGQNAAGTINVPQLGGSLANIPVRILPGWTTGNKVLAYDPLAIKTLESPGAPLRLQDENTVNLSKSFSVYGYASSFVQAADGLVKIALS